MRAHRIERFGGPDVLRLVGVPEPVPGPGEILLRHEHVGVNYVDTQHRAGRPYPVDLPLIIGIEAAGHVLDVGEGVTDWRAGDRVAYGGIMPGAYAELAAVPADRAIPLPAGVSSELAAAVLVSGWTAHMLAVSVAPPPVTSDARRETSHHARSDASGAAAPETVVVLGAAGGTGSLLVQLALAQGRRVVGVAAGAGRCAHVAALGAHQVVDRSAVDVLDAVRAASPEGVDVVFDGIGAATFHTSRRLLRPRGHLVCFGQASGPVPPVDPAVLSGISAAGGPGSLRLSWPTLDDWNHGQATRLWRSAEVFRLVAEGTLRPRIDAAIPLADAATAHRRLESGEVIGSLVLQVGDPGQAVTA